MQRLFFSRNVGGAQCHCWGRTVSGAFLLAAVPEEVTPLCSFFFLVFFSGCPKCWLWLVDCGHSDSMPVHITEIIVF
jgi:hypothetical protein